MGGVENALPLLTKARDIVLAARTLMIVRRTGRTRQEAGLDLLTISMPSIPALAPIPMIAEIATHVPTVDLR